MVSVFKRYCWIIVSRLGMRVDVGGRIEFMDGLLGGFRKNVFERHAMPHLLGERDDLTANIKARIVPAVLVVRHVALRHSDGVCELRLLKP